VKKSSKKAIILILLLIVAGAVLAYLAPQWRANAAAREVEAKAAEFIKFADVDSITITDEQIIIPSDLEGNPETQTFVANALAQRNIVEVSSEAINALKDVGIQNGWADAVGSIFDNLWIALMIIIALVWLKAKNGQEKGGSA
jgi:Flp pilus assembly protein CpaB